MATNSLGIHNMQLIETLVHLQSLFDPSKKKQEISSKPVYNKEDIDSGLGG